jgi:hypothetical protein
MYGTMPNFPKVFEFEKMCMDITRLKNLKNLGSNAHPKNLPKPFKMS